MHSITQTTKDILDFCQARHSFGVDHNTIKSGMAKRFDVSEELANDAFDYWFKHVKKAGVEAILESNQSTLLTRFTKEVTL
jgi:hypothetical protein